MMLVFDDIPNSSVRKQRNSSRRRLFRIPAGSPVIVSEVCRGFQIPYVINQSPDARCNDIWSHALSKRRNLQVVSDGPISAGASLFNRLSSTMYVGTSLSIYLVTLSNRLTVIGTFFLCRPSSQVNSHEGEIKNRRSPYRSCTHLLLGSGGSTRSVRDVIKRAWSKSVQNMWKLMASLC
jgi:hypothetical protein